MSRIFDIAHRYIDRLAEMQPILATYFGVPGHETEMPDNSPAGDAARAELDRSTLTELGNAERALIAADEVLRAAEAGLEGLTLRRDKLREAVDILKEIPEEVETQ